MVGRQPTRVSRVLSLPASMKTSESQYSGVRSEPPHGDAAVFPPRALRQSWHIRGLTKGTDPPHPPRREKVSNRVSVGRAQGDVAGAATVGIDPLPELVRVPSPIHQGLDVWAWVEGQVWICSPWADPSRGRPRRGPHSSGRATGSGP